jgi:hypothetical protein
VDRGDSEDQIEGLLQGEVVADLVSALRGGKERLTGSEHAGAAIAE